MTRFADYIPTNDGIFLTWVKTLFAYVAEHAALWGLLPDSWAHITPLITDYETAYNKAQDPNRGKADTALKNSTRNVLKKNVRQFVKGFLEYNPAVTDDDRERMGLPVHDTKPTPVPAPDSIPVPLAKTPFAGVVELHVTDSASERKAKPAGVHGFETCWAVLDTPPTDWTQLARSSFSTRTPLRLSFSGNERGKTLYFALRWENNRGVKGPWTDIMSAVIP
jgi:hypothetical protein